jgi:polyvinyl alcohol dehydrogenase (cytochrome)
LIALLLSFSPAIGLAQPAQDAAELADGEAQYRLFCAECHEGALLEAPQRAAFELYAPGRIVDVLEFGSMATSGMALSREQKRNIAFYLSGERYDEARTETVSFSCESTRDATSPLTQPVAWNGWGGGSGNARHQANETILTKGNVDRLELKWAFAFPGATRVRSQPVVTPEVTFIGSQEGTIYALAAPGGHSVPIPKCGARSLSIPTIRAYPRDCCLETSVAKPTQSTHRRARLSGKQKSMSTPRPL